jgi:hypothetical protein
LLLCTAALGTACKKIPPGKDSYGLRKRIADTMVEHAQSGGRAPETFDRIGTKTLQEITRPPSFKDIKSRTVMSALGQ